MSTSDDRWYFDLSTGEVTRGKQSRWDTRMGPYDTEAEARDALKVARERTKAADAAEEEEDDWGVEPSWKRDQ